MQIFEDSEVLVLPPFETELALIVYQLIVDIAAFPRFSSLAWPSA